MDTLLRHTTLRGLAEMLERHGECSPAPHLVDPTAVRRARRLARRNGMWDALTRRLDPSREIPVLKRSAFRNFQRCGDRNLHQGVEGARRAELGQAAMALWLGHPHADVDYLQDLLWAHCDDWTWVMAAHEGCAIDLGSAVLGATLAEILHVLGHHLEDEVKQRVSAELERRIFQPFFDYRTSDWWKTADMNWNHVCNGAVIRTVLYHKTDANTIAHMIHGAVRNMTYALDGFAEDGGCLEGPGYWGFGFGHYVYAAHALCLRTGGELNIMTGDRIQRICRYPLAAHISGRLRSTFADSHHGYIAARTALAINAFMPLPELYDLCEQHSDRTLRLRDMHELSLYRGEKAGGKPDHRDYLLPSMGQVKLRGWPGPRQMTVLALAGSNDVPHNHNDIGSFMVHKHGKLFLVDPGGPMYTRKTFSSRRYEIVFCNSLGHSVPVMNGKQQRAGAQYCGTLTVGGLNGDSDKTACIDMTRAYPRGTVKELLRTLRLDAKENRLTIDDAYTFRQPPRMLEEAFITFEKAVVEPGGKAVRIGPRRGGVRLAAVDTPGTFRITRLEEESKEGAGDKVITRITFKPARRTAAMRLQFTVG